MYSLILQSKNNFEVPILTNVRRHSTDVRAGPPGGPGRSGSRVADFARGRGWRGAGRRPPATLPTLPRGGLAAALPSRSTIIQRTPVMPEQVCQQANLLSASSRHPPAACHARAFPPQDGLLGPHAPAGTAQSPSALLLLLRRRRRRRAPTPRPLRALAGAAQIRRAASPLTNGSRGYEARSPPCMHLLLCSPVPPLANSRAARPTHPLAHPVCTGCAPPSLAGSQACA